MKQIVQLTENDKIFCNGVFLQPLEVEINGKKQWRWVLAGQSGDLEGGFYLNGERIDIYDYANDLQDLLVNEK